MTFDYKINPGAFTDGVNTVPMSPDSLLAATVTITVVQVTFEPLKTRARLGSDVNVTFQVTSGGTIISDLNVVGKLESVTDGSTENCNPSGITLESLLPRKPIFPPEGDSGSSDLRILRNKGSFRLNWDTKEATDGIKGCYKVVVTLNDGAEFITDTAVELRWVQFPFSRSEVPS